MFHIAQEGVHFRQGEFPSGAYRTVAGHGGEDAVFPRFHRLRRADFGKFAQHIPRQLFHVGLAQHLRYGAHGDAVFTDGREVQAETAQFVAEIGQGGHFAVPCGKGNGNEQRLAVQTALFAALAFHFFVVHAFGGGVHVHQKQAVFGLGKDVDAEQLGDGEAQRVGVSAAFAVRFVPAV